MVFFQTENLKGVTRLIECVKFEASENKTEKKKSIVQVHIWLKVVRMYIDQENGIIETILKIKEFKIKKIYLIIW